MQDTDTPMWRTKTHDAADHAIDTLSDGQWESLTLRAALYVLRTRQAAGRAADPARVEEIAAGVVAEFCEGETRLNVHRGVEGDDLVADVLRGLAPVLRDRALQG